MLSKTQEVNAELWQVTPYDIYSPRLPAKLGQEIKNYIRLLNQFLKGDKPKAVSTVVVTNYSTDVTKIIIPHLLTYTPLVVSDLIILLLRVWLR